MRIVVVGTGGHGRETLDVVRAAAEAGAGWELLGAVDDAPPSDMVRDRLARQGAVHLGPLERLGDLDAAFVVAIGDPQVRAQVTARLEALGFEPAGPLVHPLAVIGADVELGAGTVVAAGCHLTTNVRIGRSAMINVGSIVSHDTAVGDWVTLSPAVRLNGDVTIGDFGFLGTGAIVVPGCQVGTGAVVGAGAVVLDDVAPGQTVAGVPARPLIADR